MTSLSMLNNVSISISGDDSGEDAGNMKARVKRKRKKVNFHKGRQWILRWGLAKINRWTTKIVLLFMVLFIFLQWWRLMGKTVEPMQRSDLFSSIEEEVPANLDRMDMPTRYVNGTKEPCLKILPLEEIERLELPRIPLGKDAVKNVIYKSLAEVFRDGGNHDIMHQGMEVTRFNLFSGFQTLAEREKSFKVNETTSVHCGFYSESGGFRISEEDKVFMRTCKAVVSTCAFGGGDDLYQPIGMSQASLRKVCYVAFWDEVTRSTQETEGKRIGDDHMIGKWRIVVVKELPFSDQRLNGKIPKMLSHRLFPEARYSIWVDSKSQFRRDPIGVFEALLWRTHSSLAISEHGARSNIYDEGKAIVKKHKATPEEVEVQLTQYRGDGFSNDNRFNGKKALAEASVIVREHSPMTNLLMCLWFNEVVRFTSRDQLSFPYVLRQLEGLKVNMFPVCTRKALVNSMGHKRKVKPLSV
ncbi:unnamed protein product [Victoria cruziana]